MLYIGLVLLPPIENAPFQKTRSKKYALMSLDRNYFQIILALLTKIITLYMQITIV